MSKKLRILSLFIAVIFMVTAFAACGKSNSGSTSSTTTSDSTTSKPKETVTLKIWGGVPAENGPDKAVQAFTKEFESKGIKAVYERYVNDDTGNLKLDTALLAGEDVDLYVSYGTDRYKKRVSAKQAIDLTPYYKKDNFDPEKEMGPIVKESYIDGIPYCLPTTLATNNAWIVNKDLFDAAKIPLPTSWTFEEMREIAKKLTKGEGSNKVYGVLFPTDTDKSYAMSIAAEKLGMDLFYKNGQDKESNFDNADILKTLKIMTEMMLVDKTAISHADMISQKLVAQNLFTEGKVAISGHSWIVRDVKDTTKFPHKFVTAFVPAPTLEKDQKVTYAMGTGFSDYISINSKSSKKDQAWEYLKWYATKGMVDMAVGGRFPAYKGFDKEALTKTFMTGVESLFDQKTFKEVFLKPYENYQINKVLTKLPEIQQIAKEECEKAMTGSTTPEKAMENAKKRADEQLKK